MEAELVAKVEQWLHFDKASVFNTSLHLPFQNEVTRSEILRLKEANDSQQLARLLLSRMEFGTAGKAAMGPGNSRLNDLTIIQTTQGLLKYASLQFKDLKNTGIVVGFDGRYNSKKWAHYVANIFMNAGCTVYLFRECYPTPMLAFGVRHFKTALGVMITASHNPKEDNGYKVYWCNGSQIVSPHDKGISTCIDENLVPLESSWEIGQVESNALCHDPLPELIETYCRLQKERMCFTPSRNAECREVFTYTAMHGVGWEAVKKISSAFGFSHPLPVMEQIYPDPEMRTVKYPNPEEGRSALDLAISRAESVGSRIILANDPDADRLAVAEKQQNGQWKIFSGNELGALFGAWIWSMWRKCNPKADVSKVGMLSSTVSSKILQTIAKKEGFYFEETLTGFKWMGNRADKLAKDGIQVLFAFEEAIGFMCGDVVLDKDGVGALAVMSELIASVYQDRSSLQEFLQSVYSKYGYHITNNSYYFCYDPLKISAMFERIRHWPDKPGPAGYPQALGRFRIVGIRDLTTGYDTAYPDLKARLPVSKSSQCITFHFDNGVCLTIRTSGTEPKVKYYSELRSQSNCGRTCAELTAELQELIDLMIDVFCEPEKNGFIARSS
ncbi:phosphoglucomutase / phosphopentomutase [Paragonimus westermani]|uniref:Phosphoglucomutase / phosphopentomutase n=1 Tax=Paragonimus westermani TaxID=34504 RepID=A0A5J4NLG1_9TREM|nr:phosphoglucomutase / phosphopentomutase [Paragonimus westermani]